MNWLLTHLQINKLIYLLYSMVYISEQYGICYCTVWYISRTVWYILLYSMVYIIVQYGIYYCTMNSMVYIIVQYGIY